MMQRTNPALFERFRVVSPLPTHFRRATCAEVDCPHFLKGWITIVPTVSDKADYIRHTSGRRFKEIKQEQGMSEFRFPPGQTCFRRDQHVHPNGTPSLLVREAGGQRKIIKEVKRFTGEMNDVVYQAQKQRKAGY